MNKYHVVEVFVGIYYSLFKTSEGKIFGCGSNSFKILMLKDANREDVYPPAKTTITCDVTFCILGDCKSVVFLCVEPPPNTPNRKVDFSKTVTKRKSSSKSAKVLKKYSLKLYLLMKLKFNDM